MDQRDLLDAARRTSSGLYAVLPASLSCGDESACNAHPGRTAGRIVVLCVGVAAILMAGMLLFNLH